MDSYFELYNLPLSFAPDAAAVRSQYFALSKKYHPDRAANGSEEEQAEALQMSALNNAAYKTLSNEEATMGYVLKTLGIVKEEEKYALPPAFLMEMMELNEAIGNAGMAPDMLADAKREYEMAQTAWKSDTDKLVQRFEAGERSEALLASLKDYYYRRKYLLRLKEQIEG